MLCDASLLLKKCCLLMHCHALRTWRVPVQEGTFNDALCWATTWSFLDQIKLQTLRKLMAPHSSTLAWKIPWMEEPGGLQSMGSLRVGHDWATSLSLFTFMHWKRKWQPTPVFLPGESQGRGAWWASVYGVAQSQTLLKRLSSSNRDMPSLATFGHMLTLSPLIPLVM